MSPETAPAADLSGPYLLGVDVGTASSKGVLVTLAGEVRRQHVIPHGVSTPAPGHYEQDADRVWWADVVAIIRALLEGTDADQVVGVAVSAIGPCLLPLGAQGQPLRPGILYGLDTRAGEQVTALNRELGEAAVLEAALMAFSSQAVGPKLRWLAEHEPEVWAQTRTVATASSYLTFRLTGQHVMNRHEASHLMPLYDPATHNWTDRWADHVAPGVMARLPGLGWSDELAGHVTAEAAALTGLREGTPVAVGAVDALSEALSVGVAQPGDLMIMYGSTTFFILVQDAPTPARELWTVGGASAGQFNLAAGMSTTGILTGWFRDQFARELPGETAFDTLFEAAAQVAPGCDGLLVLPYFSGERTPVNDPQARGVIAGLTLAHTREQLFRAVLEGVGYGIRHNLETFRALGSPVRRVVAVGGGAKSATWLQIVSDISGAVQEVPATTIGASYGDAFLAGRAAGLLTAADLGRWVQPGRTVQPDAGQQAGYDARYAQYRALYPATREIVHALGAGTQ